MKRRIILALLALLLLAIANTAGADPKPPVTYSSPPSTTSDAP